MSVTIQRMLSGTYHLRVNDTEFVLTKGDIEVIADRAVSDGIVEGGETGEEDDDVTMVRSKLKGSFMIALLFAAILVGTMDEGLVVSPCTTVLGRGFVGGVLCVLVLVWIGGVFKSKAP